jgi:hypothetical protein
MQSQSEPKHVPGGLRVVEPGGANGLRCRDDWEGLRGRRASTLDLPGGLREPTRRGRPGAGGLSPHLSPTDA